MAEMIKNKTQKFVKEFFSSPVEQSLIILFGGENDKLIFMLSRRLKKNQTLLVVDAKKHHIAKQLDNVVYSYGESINQFLQKCRMILEKQIKLLIRPVLVERENSQLIAMKNAVLSPLNEMIQTIQMNRHMQEIQLLHTVSNLPDIEKFYGLAKLKNCFTQKTALIIGAGPSLNSQLTEIYERRNDFVIFAAGSAIKALEKANVKADFYVEIDIRSSDHWENIDCSEMNLIASPQISPGLASRFSQVFWCDVQSLETSFWKDDLLALCPDFAWIDGGSNTGSFATAAAVFCGSRKIVLSGIDLCLAADGSSHSDLHTHGKDKILGKRDFVKNNKGEICPTIFTPFIRAFELLFQQHSKVEFIQTSEVGICFQYAKYQKLNTIIEDNAIDSKMMLNLLNHLENRSLKKYQKICTRLINSLENRIDSKFCQKINEIEQWRQIELHSWRKEFSDYPDICVESRFMNMLKKALLEYLDYEIIGIPCHFRRETLLLGKEFPALAQEVMNVTGSEDFQIIWQRRNMIQLKVKKNGVFQAISGFFDLYANAEHCIQTQLKDKPFSGIVCKGIADANALVLLRSKMPDVPIFVIEPNVELFAAVLKYVPFISILGPNTYYFQNEELLTQQFNKTQLGSFIDFIPQKTA